MYNLIIVILSDSQQPITFVRLLINHHGCTEAIKEFMMLIESRIYNVREIRKILSIEKRTPI